MSKIIERHTLALQLGSITILLTLSFLTPLSTKVSCIHSSQSIKEMKATLMLLQGHLAIPHTYLGLLAFKPKSEIMSDKLHKLSKLSSLNLYFENAHTSATKKLWKKKSCCISSTEKAIYTKQKCNQVHKFRQYRNLSLLEGLWLHIYDQSEVTSNTAEGVALKSAYKLCG